MTSWSCRGRSLRRSSRSVSCIVSYDTRQAPTDTSLVHLISWQVADNKIPSLPNVALKDLLKDPVVRLARYTLLFKGPSHVHSFI